MSIYDLILQDCRILPQYKKLFIKWFYRKFLKTAIFPAILQTDK